MGRDMGTGSPSRQFIPTPINERTRQDTDRDRQMFGILCQITVVFLTMNPKKANSAMYQFLVYT